MRRVEIKAIVVVGNGAWDWANLEHLINLISCCSQRSWWQWSDGAADRHLRFPGFVGEFVRTFSGCGDIFCFLSPPAWHFLLSSPWPSERQLERVSALWMNFVFFLFFFFFNLAVQFSSVGSWNKKLYQWWTIGHKIEPTLSIWSISFLVAFRDLSTNELTGLPPGIFDSLASLTVLYVVSLVAETFSSFFALA